jgi:ATP-binding cassette subfamily B protein
VSVPCFGRSAMAQAVHAVLSYVNPTAQLSAPRSVASDDLTAFVPALALEAGYVSEEIELFRPDVDALLAHDCPFIVIPLPGKDRAFAVVATRRNEADLLTPDGDLVTVSTRALKDAILESSRVVASSLAERVTNAGTSARHAKLADALHEELYRNARLGWVIVLRPNAAESVPRLLKSLRISKNVSQLIGFAALQGALITVDWAIIGSLALTGHADRGSLLGAMLLWMTTILFQIASTRAAGRLTIRATMLLRQRLLNGSLSLEPEDLSTFGLGSFTVISSQADASMNLVVTVLLSLLGVLSNVVAAVAVLATAPLPGLTLAIFFGAFAFAIALLPHLASLYEWQQREHMRLSTDLVERMSGHATRLVQQTVNTWHDGEDEIVWEYAKGSQRLDRWLVVLRNIPRGYYLVSLAAVFFVITTQPTAEALALSIGGLTLAMATLGALVELVSAMASLHALWKRIRPVVGDPRLRARVWSKTALAGDAPAPNRPVLELRQVGFGYSNRPTPVLEDVNLVIGPRDRILVEGPSGGGKSTLAAILSGLRRPRSGLVLVSGLDHHTLGDADMRRSVSAAPQFYRNHIFNETLAFNLLLGRQWPPSDRALEDAEKICRELGLGALLDQMPSGLFQPVGDAGWQLSHGERSRIFLARALLHRAEVLVLDETLGALDPDTVRECTNVVLAQDQAVVVITHR